MTNEKELLKTPVTRLLDDIDRTGMNKGLRGAVTHAVRIMKKTMGKVHLKTILARWADAEKALLGYAYVGPQSVARIHTHLEAKLAAAKIMDENPLFFTKPAKTIQPDLPGMGEEQDERDAELSKLQDSPVADFPVKPVPEPKSAWDVVNESLKEAREGRDRMLAHPPPSSVRISDKGRCSTCKCQQAEKVYGMSIEVPSKLLIRHTNNGTLVDIEHKDGSGVKVTINIPK